MPKVYWTAASVTIKNKDIPVACRDSKTYHTTQKKLDGLVEGNLLIIECMV